MSRELKTKNIKCLTCNDTGTFINCFDEEFVCKCQDKKIKRTKKISDKEDGWFYGVIRKTQNFGGKTKHYYEIHEVFPWGKNGEMLWTEEPVAPFGETPKELQQCLLMMLADTMRKPVYEVRKGKLIKRSAIRAERKK